MEEELDNFGFLSEEEENEDTFCPKKETGGQYITGDKNDGVNSSDDQTSVSTVFSPDDKNDEEKVINEQEKSISKEKDKAVDKESTGQKDPKSSQKGTKEKIDKPSPDSDVRIGTAKKSADDAQKGPTDTEKPGEIKHKLDIEKLLTEKLGDSMVGDLTTPATEKNNDTTGEDQDELKLLCKGLNDPLVASKQSEKNNAVEPVTTENLIQVLEGGEPDVNKQQQENSEKQQDEGKRVPDDAKKPSVDSFMGGSSVSLATQSSSYSIAISSGDNALLESTKEGTVSGKPNTRVTRVKAFTMGYTMKNVAVKISRMDSRIYRLLHQPYADKIVTELRYLRLKKEGKLHLLDSSKRLSNPGPVTSTPKPAIKLKKDYLLSGVDRKASPSVANKTVRFADDKENFEDSKKKGAKPPKTKPQELPALKSADINQKPTFTMQTRKRQLKFNPDGSLVKPKKKKTDKESSAESSDDSYRGDFSSDEDAKPEEESEDESEPEPVRRTYSRKTPTTAAATVKKETPVKPAKTATGGGRRRKIFDYESYLKDLAAGTIQPLDTSTVKTMHPLLKQSMSSTVRMLAPVDPAQLMSQLIGTTILPSQLRVVKFTPKLVAQTKTPAQLVQRSTTVQPVQKTTIQPVQKTAVQPIQKPVITTHRTILPVTQQRILPSIVSKPPIATSYQRAIQPKTALPSIPPPVKKPPSSSSTSVIDTADNDDPILLYSSSMSAKKQQPTTTTNNKSSTVTAATPLLSSIFKTNKACVIRDVKRDRKEVKHGGIILRKKIDPRESIPPSVLTPSSFLSIAAERGGNENSRVVRTKIGPKKARLQRIRDEKEDEGTYSYDMPDMDNMIGKILDSMDKTKVPPVLEEPAPPPATPRTIYDLMRDVSVQMPSWNLHIIPDTNSFCIAQISRSRMGIPILRKSIEFDGEFSAKVYVHQLHCKRYDGIYDKESSILNLIHEIDALAV